MLCKNCKSLDLDQILSENGLKHHASREELVLSAGQGCELCAVICNEQSYRNWWPLSHQPKDMSNLKNTQVVCRATNSWSKAPHAFSILRIWQPKLQPSHSDTLNITLNCFAKKGNPASELIHGRQVAKSSSSSPCFEVASKWISQCMRLHPLCHTELDNFLPTRVVAVGHHNEEPRLLVSNGRRGTWVVLSHCWGSKRDGVTTSSNVVEREKKLGFADLPILYQDAISITRTLGYQYLWIDSLCVLQDSESDWRTESMKMDQYYQGSIMNISAPEASDSSVGIFASGNKDRNKFKSLADAGCHSKSRKIRGQVMVRNYDGINFNHDAALMHRAWAWRESVLSPRILWYFADELRWDCNTLICNESTPNWPSKQDQLSWYKNRLFEIPRRVETDASMTSLSNPLKIFIPLSETQADLAFRWWYHVLDDYVHRQITYPNDRLPGIAGLAKEFARRTGFRYVCGLWQEDFLNGLRWNAHGTKVQTDSSFAPPSWCWASVHGATLKSNESCCEWDLHIKGQDADIIDCSIVNQDDNIYGQFKSGYLILKGRWQFMNHWNGLPPPFFNAREEYRELLDRVLDPSEFICSRPLTDPEQVICTFDEPLGMDGYCQDIMHLDLIYLQLGKWRKENMYLEDVGTLYALILEPVEGNEDTYKRVGIAEIPEEDGEADRWPMKTVTIL